VGGAVGAAVGAAVGTAVEAGVGVAVGEAVGAAVGAAVGEEVGAAVDAAVHARSAVAVGAVASISPTEHVVCSVQAAELVLLEKCPSVHALHVLAQRHE